MTRRFTKSPHGGCSSVGRAPVCGTGCRGFESHHSPHITKSLIHLREVFDGPLAQLVEQLTLNQRVVGSIPTRPTINNTNSMRMWRNW